MTSDREYLQTWEQMVEYAKIKKAGRDWNGHQHILKQAKGALELKGDAQRLVESCV